MATQHIARRANLKPNSSGGKANAAPIFVDSDNSNQLTIVPGGEGSTTEVVVVDVSSAQTLTNKTLTSPVLNSAAVTQLSETVAATNVLTAAESGKVMFLSAATEFATTLPAPAAGLNYEFIVAAAPSGASYTVVTAGSPDQILAGKVISVAGDAGDVENTATATTITFVDGQSVIGDYAKVWSDGTSWYAICVASVAAGITITG